MRKKVREIGDKSRAKVMESINAYWKQHRCSPSIIDICNMVELKSSSHVRAILGSLEFQGLILKRDRRQARKARHIVPLWVAEAIDKVAEGDR